VSQADGSLKVVLYGDKYLTFVERTPKIPGKVLEAIDRFGVGVEAADVHFSRLKFQSPWAEPDHFTAQAEAAMEDLLSHFWTGGLQQGGVVLCSHGYPAAMPLSAAEPPRGTLWDRGMVILALDGLHRATGDPTISRRVKTEWTQMKRLFKPEELEDAGGPLHHACDDTGWNAMAYMAIYRHSGDRDVLARTKGLLEHGFRRWLDDEMGGGMWYSDERKVKSLYTVAVVLAAFDLAEATGDAAVKDKALRCYEWMESHLLRPDGIYWADRDRAGPRGASEPDHIREGGSVSFLGGNMGMGVLHAQLYRSTGDRRYLERAIRTANGLARKLTSGGIYFDDRDGWSNGTFACRWAEEVLSLPGMDPVHKELLRRTADSIYRNARTSRGYYGASWGGPADGPGSCWCMGGVRPEQTMTSSDSVMMIVAAAVAEKPTGPAGK
jgi:predicted alpha-1,6-mannanase (GH76 family)